VQVTLASRPSPDAVSNEDFIAATTSVVVVVDGASVPPGLATGCVHGTAWFARRLGVRVLALLTTEADHSPADSLAQAISRSPPCMPTPATSAIPAARRPPSPSSANNPRPLTTWSWATRPSCWRSRPASGWSPTTDWRTSPPSSTAPCTSTPPDQPTMTGASPSWPPSSAATATIPTASGSPAPTRPPPSTP
jgi:hypothetical protein